eukprot:8907199-Lingulodinium_polyedra.AAC.1
MAAKWLVWNAGRPRAATILGSIWTAMSMPWCRSFPQLLRLSPFAEPRGMVVRFHPVLMSL